MYVLYEKRAAQYCHGTVLEYVLGTPIYLLKVRIWYILECLGE